MSEDFARSHRFEILRTPRNSQAFVNARGDVFGSVGRVELECSFPGESGKAWTTTFSIVPTLTVPLVIGQGFLRLTETLTRFRSRLQKVSHTIFRRRRLLHMEVPRYRLPISLHGDSVLANADTGSDIDLISAEYAHQRGWSNSKLHRSERYVQLANGVNVKLLGKIRTNLQVEGVSIRDHTFYIMEGLSSDVLLGDNTLEALRVFEDHADSFVEIDADGNAYDMNLITWNKLFRNSQQGLDFETELEMEDNREAARQSENERQINALKPENRAQERAKEAEMRKQYNLRRKEMVRLRKLITVAEFSKMQVPVP